MNLRRSFASLLASMRLILRPKPPSRTASSALSQALSLSHNRWIDQEQRAQLRDCHPSPPRTNANYSQGQEQVLLLRRQAVPPQTSRHPENAWDTQPRQFVKKKFANFSLVLELLPPLPLPPPKASNPLSESVNGFFWYVN